MNKDLKTNSFNTPQTRENRRNTMTLKQIAKNKNITHCYIKKHGAYYRPNSCGYTDSMVKAGVFPKDEAILHASKCNDVYLMPVNVDEHNKAIMDEVKDILGRYLTKY